MDMDREGHLGRLQPHVAWQEEAVLPLAPSQRPLPDEASPAFEAGSKLRAGAPARWWTVLHAAPGCARRVRLDTMAHRPLRMAVRLRQGQRWRGPWGRQRRPGRRRPAAGPGPGA